MWYVFIGVVGKKRVSTSDETRDHLTAIAFPYNISESQAIDNIHIDRKELELYIFPVFRYT